MRNNFILFIGLILGHISFAQQFYIKEIKEPLPKRAVQIAATAEGGFVVLDELVNDSIFFQLFKYDTCGNLVWQRIFQDTNLSVLNHLKIAIDASNTLYIAGQAIHRKTGEIAIALTIIPPDLSTAKTQYYNNGTLPLEIDQLYLTEGGQLYLTGTYNNQFISLIKFKNDGQLEWARGIPSAQNAHITQVESNNILLTSNTVDSNMIMGKFQPNGDPSWIKLFEDSITYVSNPSYSLGTYYVVVQKIHASLPNDNYPYSRQVLHFDIDGKLLHSGERFTGRGQGYLTGNEQSTIFIQYDSIIQDGLNALTFSVFNSSGSIAAQFYYDDFEDTLTYSYSAPAFTAIPSVGADNITFALSKFAQVNDTTYKHYIGKAASPQFSFGMGCMTQSYFQKDTVIPFQEGKEYTNEFDFQILDRSTDTLEMSSNLIEDQTICMISPQSGEEQEFHCTGESVIFVDRRLGKTLTITRDTTVINDQFQFCGNTITYSTKYIFTNPSPNLPFPKAFTPNGDNLNDQFGIVVDTLQQISFSSYSLSIFNRWGEKVFESTDALQRWDGTTKGKPAPTGVYLFIARYEGKMNGTCDISGVQRGDVTLIR